MSYNREFARKEFEEHGETWLQKKLSGKLKTIFDVGANIGEWSLMTREFQPDAKIHMFEIVPKTYEKLLTNIPLDENMIPNGFGLSTEIGVVPMKCNPEHSQLSTQFAKLAFDNFVWKKGFAVTGDDYIDSREIEYVDFLKVDVEGAEGMVLEGFKNTLQKGNVGIIQFEYSYHALLSRWLLMDAYEMFRPLGYHLGKLTPNGIQFHEYTLLMETFKGPDYVAVHESRMNLVT